MDLLPDPRRCKARRLGAGRPFRGGKDRRRRQKGARRNPPRSVSMNARSNLRVAIPKGAIFEDALRALKGAGLPVEVLREDGRKLLYKAEGTEFIVSRPSDVPVFVEYGAAD